MHKFFPLYLTTLLLSATGCDSSTPDLSGSFSFLLNGEKRGDSPNAYSSLVYNPSYGYFISIGWTEIDSDLQQGLSFTIPDLSNRPYPIFPYVQDDFTYKSYFLESDGHQTLQRYFPIHESDSLTIIEHDPSTGYIEATFSGTYVASTAGTPYTAIGQTLPDTLRITQGVLTATLFNPPETP